MSQEDPFASFFSRMMQEESSEEQPRHVSPPFLFGPFHHFLMDCIE
jgi:hypothetical protein